MTEIELPKAPAEVSAEALFRHQTVAAVLALTILRYSRPDAIEQVVAKVHLTETGAARRVTARTLYRWLASYEHGGMAALEPVRRTPKCRALPKELLDFLRAEKHTDPDASLPEVLRRAVERGVIPNVGSVDRSTLWRAATRMGVPTTARKAKALTDMRRFAHPHRMRVVLVDGKHFRAGPGRLKRVAFFFLDDCTRRVLWVVVGASENSALLLRGLFHLICHFGLMDLLYFDLGPGFNSDDTHSVCARLLLPYIHGRAQYPEGHGKIEAFNKTAHHDALRGMPRPDVDPAFGSLELRIRHYLDTQYNPRPHESLSGKSPLECWDADDRELRFPRDVEALKERFILTESRRVSADNVVSIDGTFYELPIGYARSCIPVQRHLLTGAIKIVHQQRLIDLHPVDLTRNAEERRAPVDPPREKAPEPPLTAAAMAFNRDFGPIIPGSYSPLPASVKDRTQR